MASTYTVHGHLQRRDGRKEAFWTRTGLSKSAAQKLAAEQRRESGGVARIIPENGFDRHATKKSGGLRHWKVKFTRRGMEPPRPFGKTTAVVCAESREAAKEMVPASPNYPITASETTDPVSFTYRCHHKTEDESHESPSESAHAVKKKSPA